MNAGVALVGRRLFESVDKKEGHRQKQCRSRTVCGSLGASKGRRRKHIDVAHLWLHDEVKSNRLKVRRVKSEDNLADIGKKVPSNKIIRKHATSMGCVDA